MIQLIYIKPQSRSHRFAISDTSHLQMVQRPV